MSTRLSGAWELLVPSSRNPCSFHFPRRPCSQVVRNKDLMSNGLKVECQFCFIPQLRELSR